MSEITSVDLFSGPGGVAAGFKSAGIKTILAVEKVQSCIDTYRANHPETQVIPDDILKIGEGRFESLISEKGKPDIVSAGPPCETFSTAGPGTSKRYDHKRDFLFERAVRFADISGAKVFVFENVPGFKSKRLKDDHHRKIFDLLLEQLEDAGFKKLDYDMLDCVNFGVPQARKRFILIATRNGPKPTLPRHSDLLPSIVKSWDALSDLPQIQHSETGENYSDKPQNEYQGIMRNPAFWGISKKECNLTYHIAPKHRESTLERFGLIENGEGLRNLFIKLSAKKIAKLQKRHVLPKKWYIQRNRRLIPDEPSFTITSHCLDEVIHPFLHRALSVREAARLQSFPDCYDFSGGPIVTPHIYETQDKYEQIGDAVPPLLARAIGLAIVKMLSS